ncbi:cytochrome P450 2F2-like [Lytechinus variegatus]|uniref:cytochrome P450 2F2-like n=1 Tax=Lytechinus variegatus TaxID=7654 RepID=UPI001BB1794D|nr:cytochrome P450 2F2-like [Lytechinus variegatus]
MDLDTLLNPYIFCTLIMSVLVFYTQWFEYPVSNLKPLPGPRAWSILGNLPQLIAARFDISNFHERLRKMYGAVVGYRIHSHNVVVISDLKFVREVAEHPDFCGKMRDELRENFSEESNVGILTSYGQTWEEHHDVLSSFVTEVSKSKELEDISTKEATNLSKVMTDLKDKDAAIHRYSVQTLAIIFCQVIFGKVFGIYDAPLKQLVDIIMEKQRQAPSAVMCLLPSYLTDWPGSGAKRRRKLDARFVNLVKELVGDHTKPNDLKPCFVKKYREESIQKIQNLDTGAITLLTSHNLLWTCIDLMTICVDEASLCLTQSLLLLASHPEEQSRLLECIGPEAKLHDDQEPLAYLEAVQQETKRLAPDHPWSLSLVALSDVTLGEFDIPQGAVVVANGRYLRQGLDEPARFRPGRFLDGNGSRVELPQMVSFPGGKKTCPADLMVSLASTILTRHICQRFILSLPAKSAHPFDKNGLIRFSALHKTKLRVDPH